MKNKLKLNLIKIAPPHHRLTAELPLKGKPCKASSDFKVFSSKVYHQISKQLQAILSESLQLFVNIFMSVKFYFGNKSDGKIIYISSILSLLRSLPAASLNFMSRSATVSDFLSSPEVSIIILPSFIIIVRLPRSSADCIL